MTRIAFTADLHVDTYGARVDPATGLNARLLDYLRTLEDVATRARERGCEALVVAGDFTERRHPAPWLVSRIRIALAAGPSRQVYLRGNHDGEIAGGSIVTILDDGMDHGLGDEGTRSGVSRPGLEFIAYDVVLACIPYLDRHWLRAQPGFASVPDAEVYRVLGDQFVAIARGLYAEARRDYPDAAVVLVCHQTLSTGQMSEAQQAFLGDVSLVVDAGALASIGFEGIVAGHLHRHQVLHTDPPVLYTGSIERVDFGEEHEHKGFVIADVERGKFEWAFVPTEARDYRTLRPADLFAMDDVAGAIVRVLDVAPGDDVAGIRADLELAGAFEVTEVRRFRAETSDSAGGMAEGLTPAEALSEFFAADPDRDALIERGRGVLQEVA